MAILIQNNIFRLNVSVNNILLMQVPQGKKRLQNIKPSCLLSHMPVKLQHLKQLSPRKIFHYNHKKMLSLYELVSSDDKRVFE
jgi:hypothetical protein